MQELRERERKEREKEVCFTLCLQAIVCQSGFTIWLCLLSKKPCNGIHFKMYSCRTRPGRRERRRREKKRCGFIVCLVYLSLFCCAVGLAVSLVEGHEIRNILMQEEVKRESATSVSAVSAIVCAYLQSIQHNILLFRFLHNTFP